MKGASRELLHFILLTPEQQIEAIRRLHALGWAIKIEGGHKIDGAMRRRAWIIRGRTP